MSGDGPNFYDEADTHETYTAHRASSSSANEVLDRPVIEDLIGDVRGLDILDLGCGLGEFGAWLLAKGCASYTGLDGSERMITAAKTALEGTPGQLIEGDIRTWDYPRSKFDLVVSRLALHYVEDLKDPLSAIHRALRDSGRVVFSVEHPVITSSDESSRTGGKRGSWIVDRYFETGRRQTRWMGSEVSKYHRTVEDYFSLVQQAGFTVESLRESRPNPKFIPDPAELKRRQRIPLMLFLAGRRLNSNSK
jgi:SAM-dependent methyltransferase